MKGGFEIFRNFAFAILLHAIGVFLRSAISQDALEIHSVDQLRAKLDAFSKKALSIEVDGFLKDWEDFPVFGSRTNDGCIDSKMIAAVRLAPLVDRLVAGVTIEGTVSDETDLIVDVDLWGQMQVDLRLTIPLHSTTKPTVSLNTSESWYSDESPRTKAFECSGLDVSYLVGGDVRKVGVVEFSLDYRELRKSIADQTELKNTYAKRKGALPNSWNVRSWVRISPSLSKKNTGVIDRGVACACWVLSEKTILPNPKPVDGVTYLDIPFDNQWYIGQAGFGFGSHAQLHAYDLYETDRWLHPSRIWRTPKNEEYYSWRKPIYAPATGKIRFQREDAPDIPSFAPKTERVTSENRVVIESEENNALISLLHFAKDSVRVELGDQTLPSKVIAETGNSGQTGWPHLHIECRVPPNTKELSDAVPLGFKHACVSLSNDTDDPWRLDLPYWQIQEGFFVCPSAAIVKAAMLSKRIWQDRSGRFKVDAHVLEYDSEKLKLRKADGTTVTIPISKLSYDDQTLVYYALRNRTFFTEANRPQDEVSIGR